MTKSVLLGIHDMLLASKVNSVARVLGIPVISTFSTHDLLSKAHCEESSLVIIDLDETQLHPVDAIAELKKDGHTCSVAVVGFHSKADAQAVADAKKAGCDLVIGTSQFFESLEDILTGKIVTAKKSS